MASTEYKPVPVAAAKTIAEQYDKPMVIIIAHDPVYNQIHTTTYGIDPQHKGWAARGGEVACRALGGITALATPFEDYRLAQATKLLTELKSVVNIAREAALAWDRDEDSRVGKILGALADPQRRGYRADIDAIHEAVKEAEKFLAS